MAWQGLYFASLSKRTTLSSENQASLPTLIGRICSFGACAVLLATSFNSPELQTGSPIPAQDAYGKIFQADRNSEVEPGL